MPLLLLPLVVVASLMTRIVIFGQSWSLSLLPAISVLKPNLNPNARPSRPSEWGTRYAKSSAQFDVAASCS